MAFLEILFIQIFGIIMAESTGEEFQTLWAFLRTTTSIMLTAIFHNLRFFYFWEFRLFGLIGETFIFGRWIIIAFFYTTSIFPILINMALFLILLKNLLVLNLLFLNLGLLIIICLTLINLVLRLFLISIFWLIRFKCISAICRINMLRKYVITHLLFQ